MTLIIYFFVQLNVHLYQLFMVYMLKFTCNYHMPLLKLSVYNSTRYPRSATLALIRYRPTLRYLVP